MGVFNLSGRNERKGKKEQKVNGETISREAIRTGAHALFRHA